MGGIIRKEGAFLVKKGHFEKNFLSGVLFLYLLLFFPVILRKRPIKVWIYVYLMNAITNGFLDKLLVKYKIITYPVRLFPNKVKINVLFDFLVYPLFTVLFNQITLKDRPFLILRKLFLFMGPMYFLEHWAVQKTNLIKWHKGWKGYHSFFSLTIKSLISRLFIELFRRIRKNRGLFQD
ncbi:CBO0543 family protein [Neobacillus terrae]|uniref:CBO0543 family protein n=1 Tax=Neobacillus terrae TaxID=3034837 RepID=UPI0030836E86